MDGRRHTQRSKFQIDLREKIQESSLVMRMKSNQLLSKSASDPRVWLSGFMTKLIGNQ
jgi:hypothetical protein